MDLKTKQKLETILAMGDVKIKVVADKKVKFYDQTPVVTAYEVRSNGELIGTFCNIDGTPRIIYPRGHESKHTSIYGRPLFDYAEVLRYALPYALTNLRNELSPLRD